MKKLRSIYKISILVTLVIFLTNLSMTNPIPGINHGDENSIMGKSIPQAFGQFGPVPQVNPIIQLDKAKYTWTDRVYITVIAPNSNLDPNLIDTINVTISTRGNFIPNYKLVETGVNTGIFTGYVIFTGNSTEKGSGGVDGNGQNPSGIGPTGTGPTDGLMPVLDQDKIQVTFTSNSTVFVNSALIGWNIGGISWLGASFNTNGNGMVQVVDPDMNLNPNAVDMFDINVSSISDPKGSTLTMIETGQDTGIFQGTVHFNNIQPSKGDMLHAVDGDTVTAEYVDRTLPPPNTTFDQLRLTATAQIGLVPPPPPGTPPHADAGPPQVVNATDQVTLDGTKSTGGNLKFSWQQIAGETVQLLYSNTAKPVFTAPNVALGNPSMDLVFTDTVSNPFGNDAAVVHITVVPAPNISLNNQIPLQVYTSNPIPIKKIVYSYTKNFPKFTPTQLQNFENYLETIDKPELPLPITNTSISYSIPNTDTISGIYSPIDFHQKNTNQIVFVSQGNTVQPISFTMKSQLNETINFNVTTNARLEPTAAHGGSTIFYSSNFFAATSTDNGQSWNVIDPNASPPSPFFIDGFQADSDVVYDSKNGFFIWYQQGPVAGGENSFRLSFSKDALTWKAVDVAPLNINSAWGGAWWDYPQLALTDKYLYITTNLQFASGQYDNVILRQNLADMESDKSLDLQQYVWVHNEQTITPVQGATDTMYFASQNTNDKIKIYTWNDNTGSIAASNIYSLLHPWMPSNRGNIVCNEYGVPNDWCYEADNRILNGWLYGDKIGFFWNANADSAHGFKEPYVDGAIFDIKTLKNVDWSYIKSDSLPWMYAYSSPNAKGLGLIAFSGENSSPNPNTGTADFSTSPPTWNFFKLRSSTHQVQAFGDYVRVRSFDSTGCLWMGTGYTTLNDPLSSDPIKSDPFLVPFLTIFGSDTCPAYDSTKICASGLTQCSSNICANTQTDSNNCGTCGNVCGSGATCQSGQCVSTNPCTNGQMCGGTCSNLNTDSNNCGACGTVCTSSQTCQSGACTDKQCMIGNANGYSSPEIKSIVDFRENKIMKTAAGSNFMTVFNAWYFSFSPYVADYETQHPWFKQLVKTSSYPLVSAILISEKPFSMIGGDFGVLATGLIVSSLIGAVYFSPLVVITKSYAKNKFNTKFVMLTLSTVIGAAVLSIVVNNQTLLMITIPLYVIIIIATSTILTTKIIHLLIDRVKRKFS